MEQLSTSPMGRPKIVHVRAYDRFRLGRSEHVRSHYRSLPHQYAFNF